MIFLPATRTSTSPLSTQGPAVLIAVPDPAAVIPRLLWGELSEDECLSTVGEGNLSQVILRLDVHMCLRGKDRVVQEPGDLRKGSSADHTPQHGGGKLGVGSVEIFHLRCHVTSNWDWANVEERRTFMRRREISGREWQTHHTSPSHVCVAHTHFQSHRFTHQLLRLSFHPASRHAHVHPGYHGDKKPDSEGFCSLWGIATFLSSTEREKFTGWLPLVDQQVMLPW